MKIENSFTRSWMPSHDDSRAIGVRNVVSTTSIRLMPSRPSEYSMPKVGIQAWRSANWKAGAAADWSNQAHRNSDATSVTSEMASAPRRIV